jgi:ATP-dependent Clp protease ATP-binding subunit ClpA
MFERFTREARATVVGAQEEARRLASPRLGTEHLLLGLLDQDTPTGAVLGRHGLTRDELSAAVARNAAGKGLDADALSALGIDLDAVRSTVEAAFGPGALDDPATGDTRRGHVPLTPRAKKVLELSLREALAMKSRSISDGHIALGIIRDGDGVAMRLLTDRGVDPAELREEIRLALAS